MSRYRKVHCLIWNDNKFPFCSDDCQMVFFHLLTSPLSTPCGIYKASLEALAAEKRWTLKRYCKAFKEAISANFVNYDEKYHVVFIPKFLKYNPPSNANVLRSWGSVISEIPETPFTLEFLKLLKAFVAEKGLGFQEAFRETFEKPFGKPSESLCQHSSSSSKQDSSKQEQDQRTSGSAPSRECSHKDTNIPYQEIIEDLNQRSGKKYRVTDDTKELIRARWHEGFTIEDFQTVHANMATKWRHDPKQNQYLRPATLYRASKFQGYLNATASLSDKGVISTKMEKGLQAFKEFIGEEKHAEQANLQ